MGRQGPPPGALALPRLCWDGEEGEDDSGYRAEDRSLGSGGRRRVRFWSPPVTLPPRIAWAGPFSGPAPHLLDQGHLCHPRTREQSRCFLQWTVHGTPATLSRGQKRSWLRVSATSVFNRARS